MSRLRTDAAQELAELAPLLADGPRLSRGRGYQRKGNVTDLVVLPGEAVAYVVGSRAEPYEVTIACREAGENERGAIGADIVAAVPRPLDVAFTCYCPDWGDPCKHGVAVLLELAREVDDDPGVLLRWRGVDDVVPPAPEGTESLIAPADVPTGPGSMGSGSAGSGPTDGSGAASPPGSHAPVRSTWGRGDNVPSAETLDTDADDAPEFDTSTELGRFFTGAMPEGGALVGPIDEPPLDAYGQVRLVVENIDVAPVFASALDAIADHWLTR